MAKDWTTTKVFEASEFPPDSLLVADVPKVLRLIMERMNNVIPDLYTQGIKIGQIVPWFWDPIPDGYLTCDGSSFDASKYPLLRDLLGGNILPDLRGLFIRGLAQGKDTYDPDGVNRTLMSIQRDAIVNITGRFINDNQASDIYPPSGAFYLDRNDAKNYDADSDTDRPSWATVFDASRVVNTGGDVRPNNIAAKYIICAIGSNKLIDGSIQLGSLNVSPNPIKGTVGQTGHFTVTPNPAGFVVVGYSYTSTDTDVVTVDSSGNYEIVGTGSAIIYITETSTNIGKAVSVIGFEQINDFTVVFPTTVNINSIAYPTITVDPDGIQYSVKYKINYTQGDPVIATVEADGKVTTFGNEGDVSMDVTVTDLGGNSLTKTVNFKVAKAVVLEAVTVSIQKEIPVGTQANPIVTITPSGLQTLIEYEVTYNSIFGTTVAVVDPAVGTVTGLYANAPATLKVTVRDLQGTVKVGYASFVVTNSSWFVEKVYCRMDINPDKTIFSNGEEFKVRIIDKLGVMDFTQISADYLSGYSTNADLVSTVKAAHVLEYTMKFKDNTPAGTILQLDWLPTEATKVSGDTGWPTTGDPVEYCQCRNWTPTSDGINSIGVPALNLTYVNGYNVYNGVVKEAIIVDDNNFLDFTANHGSNSVTPVGVSLNGDAAVVTSSMVRIKGIFFPLNTPVGSKGGIRWTSNLNAAWFIQDFNLTSSGNLPSYVVEFNTVDNTTFRSTVESTNGDFKSNSQDRVYKVRIRDANNVTDFTTMQSAGNWNTFQFTNTYRTGNMTVVANYIEFEIRLNNGLAAGVTGGIRWDPDNDTHVLATNAITSLGQTLTDISVKVINSQTDISAYQGQTIPVLVGSPNGKYNMAGLSLTTMNGNVPITISDTIVTVAGVQYVVAYLKFNTLALVVQQVVIKHETNTVVGQDTTDITINIQGLGALPAGTNINTNGLVLNIPKQFTGATSTASFTTTADPQLADKNIVLFGDSGVSVVAGSLVLTGNSGTFEVSTGGVARTANVKLAPAAGTYNANDINSLLYLVGE